MNRRNQGTALAAALALTVCLAPASVAQQGLDPQLKDYQRVPGVAGTIKSVGSDTMNNLMALWAEGFKEYYPNVRTEIEGKGSSTAPPALIAGTASFGPMSREMKSSEVDQFVQKYGYKPTCLAVGIDMLAIYVHRDNPIESLSLSQADALFSKFRQAGGARDCRRWGDLLTNPQWVKLPISLYGRNAASGTYGYFKEHVLLGGDFKDDVKEQPGSSAVVQGIATDRSGVGYSGIGYKTADVRAVPLKVRSHAPAIPAEAKYAYSGDYPLSRSLLLCLNRPPGKDLDPLRREFIRYIFSRQGQRQVIKDGYLPVTGLIAREMLAQIENAEPPQ